VKARTREALEAALKEALLTITEADARAWFTHCGYPVHSSVMRSKGPFLWAANIW
jgi:hypothetical protein